MLFNSYIFVLMFLPLCLIGYFGLNRMKKYSLAQIFLLGMSLWFYGYFNVKYLLIIIFSVLFNYGVYRFMVKIGESKWRKPTMILGVSINVGVLVYFARAVRDTLESRIVAGNEHSVLG